MKILQIMGGGFLVLIGAVLLGLGLLASRSPASGSGLFSAQLSQIGFALVIAGVMAWFILPRLKRLRIIKS